MDWTGLEWNFTFPSSDYLKICFSYIRQYKCRYLENATIRNHSYTEASEEGEHDENQIRMKGQNNRHILNHRGTNIEKLQQRNCLEALFQKISYITNVTFYHILLTLSGADPQRGRGIQSNLCLTQYFIFQKF